MSGSTAPAVLRASWAQARVTVRRKYLSPTGISALVTPVIFLTVLWFFRDSQIRGLVPTSAWLFSGMLTFGLVAGAVLGVAADIQAEREDGTLLRAKAVPHGMTGHLLAKLVVALVDALVPVFPLLGLAAVLLPELLPGSLGAWVGFGLLYLLATAAMLPWGAVLGSLFRTAVGVGVAGLVVYAVAAVSGILYPLTALPGWLQVVGQATPQYWIGLGMRRALLDPSAASLEVGGTWRTELVVGVLLAWAVAGIVLAPVLLRRMARRQSGRAVAEARDRVLSRGY
ncbi:ABC transporter permease [Ornithinimicrobium sp. LYQ121]|uniref:ABC transporter permease n=1 Tax=Ornithinimicrobium sp. LYQ121 TaxID=3378801 RepID=UPI0038521239